MMRVGFIINSRVPEPGSLFQGGLLPHHLLSGWDDSASPMSFMRFHWVANELRKENQACYELYRPWRRYDAVVFLKSMGPHCVRLARKLKAAGTKVVFEANVDYYTPLQGEGHLAEMAPSAEQRADAIAITEMADVVIGTSRHLTAICAQYNANAFWVPDNVCSQVIPATQPGTSVSRTLPLPLWWSGVAAKAFEFLLIEDVLKPLGDRVHLHLVTDDFAKGRSRWRQDQRERMDALLKSVPHSIHTFGSIQNLLGLYAQGPGLILSPRFLDNPYNLGHTEWKITLGMACGLPALASPLPSYLEVEQRAESGAIRICHTPSDWKTALAEAMDGTWNLSEGGKAAREVVQKHYTTAVVARQHLQAISHS